ncbi:MAG: MdtA/MuxA family multidrug efflux RND transporter periplasmic adaptor subunit [Sulfuricellaceae bacterium]|nr:MdtA/MuxA family multidrug efflux RND transporter periplasmic adaptor subunit [Sulfuricellaceae bacterium]
MKTKFIWIAFGIAAAAGITAAVIFHAKPAVPQRHGMNGAGRPVPPVVAATAKTGDSDVVIDALGTVTARDTATVRARVDGLLTRLNFREGQTVKAGELLAEIDPRPYRVLVEQARGQLMRDRALLANARVDLERYRNLLAKDSIAKQQVDGQEALVRQYQGAVVSDQAQLDNAALQLSFTRVTAPVSGRLGLRQVDAGNMVRDTDVAGIAVITQTQPITVVFPIPAAGLTAVFPRLQAGDTLRVEAYGREGKDLLASGKLLTVDNQIDTATGTVKLKAEFANAGNTLFPNQFVNVRLHVATIRGATLIPVAAVQRGTPGTFCYVIGPDRTVSVRPVVLGPVSGDTVAVEKGLAPGERVVIDGADKLRPGAKVNIATPGAAEAGRKGVAGERRGGKARERRDGAAKPAPAAPGGA